MDEKLRGSDAWFARELLGDDLAQTGIVQMVMHRSKPVDGVVRVVFGGVVLSDFGVGEHGTWERQQGQLLFVPTRREILIRELGLRLDQMVTGPLAMDSYWTPVKEGKHER